MKIAHIETYPTRIPLKQKRRMISALGQHTVSDFLLVRILTDEGIEGAGEATVTPRWSGETVWGAQAVIERLFAPSIIGCDPRDVGEIDRRMDRLAFGNWFAKSAIEMACWDIQGKAAGQPVYELLGGACRPLTVRCRFSMGAYEPDRATQLAAELVAAGFSTIKVKVGGRPKDDIARVSAVRQAAGAEVDLVIDANCGWDAATAIESVHAMSDCRISLVEQPTPRGDFGALARVRREIDPPVMADDICFDLADAQELVRCDCCDVISVYPGKQGGIRKCRLLAEFAAEHGIACSIGSNLEWDVATAAMAHVVVATQNIQVERYPGDMLGPEYHEFSIAREPLEIDGPLVTVPSGPGLGIEVDWERVKASPCD